MLSLQLITADYLNHSNNNKYGCLTKIDSKI